jgi:hypothetical protein
VVAEISPSSDRIQFNSYFWVLLVSRCAAKSSFVVRFDLLSCLRDIGRKLLWRDYVDNATFDAHLCRVSGSRTDLPQCSGSRFITGLGARNGRTIPGISVRWPNRYRAAGPRVPRRSSKHTRRLVRHQGRSTIHPLVGGDPRANGGNFLPHPWPRRRHQLGLGHRTTSHPVTGNTAGTKY